MESDKILVAAGITAAAVVGAFVFWGPSPSSGSGRGRLAGLVNFGRTCFLNAILHALAACPPFIAWLEQDRAMKESSLRRTLATVLSVVNGTNRSVQDTYAPAAVMNALKRLGWVIPSDEQDAHELFNILISTLDEENNKVGRKYGCLSDALGLNDPNATGDGLEKMLDLKGVEETPPITSATTPTTPPSEFSSLGSVMSLNELCRPNSLTWRTGPIRRNRWISRSCRALQMCGPMPSTNTAHPFTGTLASQLRCTECGHKSTVRNDRFISLSLTLPQPYLTSRHKLHQLLTNFMTPEHVDGVQCEGCGQDSSSRQLKLLSFGKLPMCLCIHISRTTWYKSGGLTKRADYVQFPMRLSLAPYTFAQHYQLYQRYPSARSEGGSPLSSSMPVNSWPFHRDGNSAKAGGSTSEFRNVYQLVAVIVHSGDVYSGHFVTYRRGYQTSKWYLTSDAEIREVTIDEVLQSTAYMLFYEKTSSMSML